MTEERGNATAAPAGGMSSMCLVSRRRRGRGLVIRGAVLLQGAVAGARGLDSCCDVAVLPVLPILHLPDADTAHRRSGQPLGRNGDVDFLLRDYH